jgi:hypothetical protein
MRRRVTRCDRAAKAVQGVAPENSVKLAHEQRVKIYG